jgi:hypothetical protein
MNFRRVSFLFRLLVLFPSAARAEGTIELEILFPLSEVATDWLAPSVIQSNVIGAEHWLFKMNFPLKGRVRVKNAGEAARGALAVELEAGPGLEFLPALTGQEAARRTFQAGALGAGKTAVFDFELRRPSVYSIPAQGGRSFLRVRTLPERGEGEIKSAVLVLELKNPFTPLTTGALFALLLLLAFALFVFIRRARLFSRFSTYELVTLAVFTAFYVLGSFLSGFIRSFGLSSVLMHVLWALYSWTLLLVLVRLVPKPGSVSALMILGALLTGLLIFGLDPLMLVGFTLPGALVLEIWFGASGYGRTLFSALGAGLCYSLCPVAFFWFFVTPAFYHIYYAPGFIWFWVATNLAVYLAASVAGNRAADYFKRVIH